MSKFICIFFLLLGSNSFAAVKVAFMEAVNEKGEPVRLAPGERFYHVAIQIDGLWYDSAPKRKVIGSKRLRIDKNNFLSLIVGNEDLVVPKERIHKFIGWNFDYTYSWLKHGKTYCSKLVANILGIKPTPMEFSSPKWQLANLSEQKGKLGISPDELLKPLKEMGFSLLYDRRIGYLKESKSEVASARSCSSIL